jgi:pyridoxal phosphate-dependent aminotransferase EpsN
MSGRELDLMVEAFRSNWVAPLGPCVDAFEAKFANRVGSRHAVALSSGTAALHLGLLTAGVGPGDEVLVSSFTFIASANPIRYLGATPVFVDSEQRSWNLDPAHVAQALRDRARRGRLPRAVVAVHIYGQTADLAALAESCGEYGVALIEDASEALGATFGSRPAGTIGAIGAFSFNGNKILTTSGGGMLVTDDDGYAARVRKLATQARDPAPHYQHSEIGYNYRLSNLLAAVGVGQLAVLDERVAARRRIFEQYEALLAGVPGIALMPDPGWGLSTRWLTVARIEADAFGADRESVRLALEAENIEARPVWKPLHMQPVFDGCEMLGGSVCEAIFSDGLCLPSGSAMRPEDVERVAGIVTARRAG